MSKIKGPVLAIVTPFNIRTKIDFGALKEYLGFIHECGVRNIIVNGSTGEFASLTLDERKSVLEYCRIHFPGSIVAHVSACAVMDCIILLKHAVDCADAALLLPPYYYSNVAFTGLQVFFEEVIEKSNLPVYIYNFPRHTNINIEPRLLKVLSERYDSLLGVKDSSGSLDNAMKYKSVGKHLQVFFGGDSIAFNVLKNGLDGSVTGGGNPVPECLVNMYESFMRGQQDIASKWQSVFDIWTQYRKRLDISEIAVAKLGLRARIHDFPIYVRPPFSTPDPEIADSVVVNLNSDVMPAIFEALKIST